MDKRISYFGIDFGTTNSAVYSFTGAGATTRGISYGDDENRPMPSLVAIHKTTGEIKTGRKVKDGRNTLSEDHRVFSSIKSVLDSGKPETIAGKEWSSRDIVAEIFKALKAGIEHKSPDIMDEAVVSVPVGFKSEKKEILRYAANDAGIRIKMFVSEPIAAFCSNYHALKSCRDVAVFDWGGGTLDVVVLRIENGEIFELASSSMASAGDDIDEIIARKMHKIFMSGHPDKDKPYEQLTSATKDTLIAKCETMKCNFSDNDIQSVSINKYDDIGAVHKAIEYYYFAEILQDKVNDAIQCLKETIDKAKLNKTSLDKILCVGGSSYLRPLRERLKNEFDEDKIYYPESVMWDIAMGAAWISMRPGKFVLNKPVGLLLCNDEFLPLIKKSQPIEEYFEERKLTFGVTDTIDGKVASAKFIFMDSENETDNTLIENNNVVFELRGFEDEVIPIYFYIDPDFNFKVKIGSNKRHPNCYKVWEYSALKIRYRIEG